MKKLAKVALLAAAVVSPSAFASHSSGELDYNYVEFSSGKGGSSDDVSDFDIESLSLVSQFHNRVYMDVNYLRTDYEQGSQFKQLSFALGHSYDLGFDTPADIFVEVGAHQLDILAKVPILPPIVAEFELEDSGYLFETGVKTNFGCKYIDYSISAGAVTYSDLDTEVGYIKNELAYRLTDHSSFLLSGKVERDTSDEATTATQWGLGLRINW